MRIVRVPDAPVTPFVGHRYFMLVGFSRPPFVPLALGWRGLAERALWRGAGGPRELEICCFSFLYPLSKFSAVAHGVAKVLLPRHRDTGG